MKTLVLIYFFCFVCTPIPRGSKICLSLFMSIYIFVCILFGELFREYKLLNLLDFTSKRKRMSVIVRDEEGQLFLLCKGADRLAYKIYCSCLWSYC
jgi:magnesium-transporting ATPase (P-type)